MKNNPIIAVSASGKHGQSAERLIELLVARGWKVIVLPDICGLRPGTAGFDPLDSNCPLILFSPLQPRAAFWTLRALGIAGCRTESLVEAPAGDQRPILCLNFTTEDSPEELVRQLEDRAGAPVSKQSGELLRPQVEAEERWYPVIDYDRCEHCGECMEFCLFGVYDTDEEERVVASDPDACKPGCPACSRVCPQAAIMFPLHVTEPAIAGSDAGSIKPLDMSTARNDLAALPEGTLTPEDMARACSCASDGKAAAATGAGACACECERTTGADNSKCSCCGDGKPANSEDRDGFDDLVQNLAEE